jgi:hypothetical protein
MAEELGLDRSALTLGLRGLARSILGDPGGLRDMREGIALATRAGQGREVARLHNNLGYMLRFYEGPRSALEVFRAGVTFARAGGLADIADGMLGGMLDPLVDDGELDEALAVGAAIAPRLEGGELVRDLAWVRAVQTRILVLQGQATDVATQVEWIETAARRERSPEYVVTSLGSCVLARAWLGQDDKATALIGEIGAIPGVRETPNYTALLPAMVRAALVRDDPTLAESLVHGTEPRYPYAEHALVTANAALTEARGDLQAAADTYADAADRWERFGVVPEHAFALVGQGRCLIGLVRPTEAVTVLQHASEIFERLRAAPALAETDALLQLATALSS